MKNNPVYAQYVKLIGKDVDSIDHYTQIPFLPITFFKTQKVTTTVYKEEVIFESSSTTGVGVSKNYVRNLSFYHKLSQYIFESRFGPLTDYHVLGLLPNYLEKGNSSLVNMVTHFMHEGKGEKDAFFLYDHKDLANQLLKMKDEKVLLFGVSFALLDFAESYTLDYPNVLVIETGGMKGRKKEITKTEVYLQLKTAMPTTTIVSEYGMTELMSQAYSDEKGIYTAPNWMKIIPRQDSDPFASGPQERTAAINIIDLGNINTCSFIATDDLGRIYPNGKFEILGRLDAADVRGCSLMV